MLSKQLKVSIISVEIIKTIDERELQKNKRKAKTERSQGSRSYSERVTAT